MSDKKFQRFGKYLILDHLVDGGMAKICRARYLGEQANKMVAVKMVQPQFSNDEAFARMFQDELNITFGMLHPNIMQVYDYGKTNGQLYTAMEYIHGANLKQYLDRLKEKKVVFPVEISCYIISQVCLGLHYAHTFTDKLTGKPYNIVHRDISPHNIMLTYDGAVKVIDFGIAKANTNSEATQAGTIKGKLSYLAPEYLDGLELDARYDEFAVGITLWEMLCSRKLFQANNDLAVLKQIQACKIIPPSEINPLVPKELDQIVMKALSKDRTHRYENLDQMNRALVRFLYSTYPDFNASDLKTFAYDLFKAELASDNEKFVEYGKIDTQAYIEDMKQEESRTGKISKKEAGVKAAAGDVREKIREIDLQMDTPNLAAGIEIERDPTTTKKLSKTAMHSAKLVSKSNKPGLPSSTPASPITSSPSARATRERTATRQLPKKELSNMDSDKAMSSPMLILVFAASLAAIAYFQAETVEKATGFNLRTYIHGRSPERTIATGPDSEQREPAANNPAPVNADLGGKIVIVGADMSMEVFINGSRVEYLGLRPIAVKLNEEATITVKKKGYLSYTQKVTPVDANKIEIQVPELKQARMGLLTSSQNYTAGSKLVYEEAGESVELTLPFTDLEIPEGTYQAKVINPILGTEKKVEFSIEENKKHFLE